MTTTNFIDKQTVIEASWLNDVDAFVYGGANASTISYTDSGTGAVATDVQTYLRRGVIYPETYGAIGDGTTNDFAALQLAATAAIGKELYIRQTYLMSAGSILILSSNTIISGPGKIIGPSIASQAAPSVYIKIQGTLSTIVPYSSTITEDTVSFTVTNTFAADDMLVLSNFPTDATDAYTETAADWLGEKRRAYANTSSSNLRQTRRRELAVVRSASGAAFELNAGAHHAYTSTTSLQFQKVIPITRVNIKEITIENVLVQIDYGRNINIDCTLVCSSIVVRSTMQINITSLGMDQKDTGNVIDIHDHTAQFTVNVTSTGGNLATDNAIIRVDQVWAGNINADISGTKGKMYGVLIDSNFTENPMGYTDVPTSTIVGTIVCNKCAITDGPNVFVTCDPYFGLITNINLDITSDNSTGNALYLKGVRSSNIQMTALLGSIRFDGVQDIFCRGKFSSLFEATIVDPRGSGTKTNTGLDLYYSGVWTPTINNAVAPTTTYLVQTGTFTRSGNMVEVDFYLGITLLGNGVVSQIAGLPFTSGAFPRYTGNISYFTSLAVSVVSLYTYVLTASSVIRFEGLAVAGSTSGPQSVFGNGTEIIGRIRYNLSL